MERLVRPRLVAAVAAVWAALAAVLFAGGPRFSVAAVERACGRPAPDVLFAPDAATVRAFVTGCGPAGLAAWRDLQVVDLLYPAVTAALVAGLVLLAAARLPARLGLHRLAFLAVPVAAADYAENLAAWFVIRTATVPDRAATLLAAGSAVKNVASWAAWLAVTGLAVAVAARLGLRRVRPRLAGTAG